MAPCDWIGTHMKSSFGGDPVEDHTKHNGKCNTDLFAGSQMKKQSSEGNHIQYHQGTTVNHQGCRESVRLTINNIITMLVM